MTCDAAAITLDLPDPRNTQDLARGFGALARPGVVIALHGPVGAGKTVFARHLIQHLQSETGCAEDIPSPTYTIVQTYQAGTLEIWHADLYRLGGPDDAIELGLVDAMEDAFCLIEWPDRLGRMLPPDAIHLTLQLGAAGGARNVTMHCADTRLLAAISGLCTNA